MKLVKANIYGFGKWVDQKFNFERDYQVIFGFNEAGKTTLLNFIQSIMFGFASGRGDNKFLQYKPKNSSKYGGELTFESADGSNWIIRRVAGKGNGKVTLFHNDDEVPESLITRIIGNFSRDDFENTHIFDDKSILSIYGLNENQLETEVMSIGAVGSKEWLETAEKLENEAEAIYKPKGQKQPLVVNLKKNDQLLEEKSEIENQQVAYQRVKSQFEQVKNDFDINAKQLAQVSEKQNHLRNLDKKWSRYEQLKNNNSDHTSDQTISNEDWENVLKANQELSTLKETISPSKLNNLDNVEKNILKNYRKNQTRLDYVRNQKFELQNLQFHRDNMNTKLLKVDTQVDQLFKNHPELSEHMLPLTGSEIDQLTPVPNKNNNMYLIICGIAIVLSVVISSPLRWLFILIAIACGGWYWYQTNNDNSSNDLSKYPFLKAKGYENLSREQIISLQGTVIALDNFHTTQNGLIGGIKSIELDMSKWRKILIELDVLDESYKGDNYNEQIEKYFVLLDQIKAKFDLAEQNQQESKKIDDVRRIRVDKLNKNIFAILQKYQAVNMDEFIQMHTQQIENQNVISKIEQDKDFLGNDLSELKKYANHNELIDKLNQIMRQKTELTNKNNELSRQMGSLKEQMQQVFDNEHYQRTVNELAQNQADIIENYDEWLAKKLAGKWIRNMLNIATENRYPKMIKRATEYFSLLTNGHYIKIDFNKKDIVVTSLNKNLFDVHELSRATTIQLYLSLRLAFVTEISDLIKLPILIDDAFVDFDISRRENIFKLIQEISKTNQVIYVTANEPENVPSGHILKLEGKKSA